MRKGHAISSLVIARSIRLLIVFIQPHSLPVIDRYRLVKESVGRRRRDSLDSDALISIRTSSCSSDTLRVVC